MKEYLNILLERNYNEPTLPPIIKYLVENYDNDQLLYLLNNGIKISQDLILYYYPGSGFRCMNENSHIIGNKPICGVIERTLNNKWVKS
jgi:hypothetical protein